jgi:S-methylmethionine-dependent homocysteine/selenocysteine methylase
MTDAPAAQARPRQLLDGGVGSELRQRGVKLSDRCWSAEANLFHRRVLTEIHQDYIRAGADIITANTFATTRFVLACAGLDSRFDEINRSALEVAQIAADSANRPVLIAGSLSCLPPMFGNSAYPKPDVEYRDYVELCDCFADFGADLILLEMMQDTEHAPLACRAAQSTDLPFWIGISCLQQPRDDRLVAFDYPNQPLDAVIEALLRFDPAGISIMHSPPDAIGPAIDLLKQYWTGPIGAYAEIPYARDPDQTANDTVSVEQYAAFAAQWLDQGAAMIGGCCGTTPAHIATINRLARAI